MPNILELNLAMNLTADENHTPLSTGRNCDASAATKNLRQDIDPDLHGRSHISFVGTNS
jgi:hypothetical protein